MNVTDKQELGGRVRHGPTTGNRPGARYCGQRPGTSTGFQGRSRRGRVHVCRSGQNVQRKLSSRPDTRIQVRQNRIYDRPGDFAERGTQVSVGGTFARSFRGAVR